MTMPTCTGADALVRALSAAGVSRIFGLPGDTGVELYDALRASSPVIDHVLCRDERHAVTMADVWARCTNQVGVVEVSSGGGATFCIGGLGEAFAASVPMLVISSDIHARSRGTGALTELDQVQLFAAVTKWRARIEDAAQIAELVATALRAATSGRPAPVALIVPENVLSEQVPVRSYDLGASIGIPAERPVPDHNAVNSAAALLAASERPAIVAGGGVHSSQAYRQLMDLAERAGVPVATTVHGKGTFDETSQWSLGVVGANGARPYANKYLAMADAVLLVGTRANATDTNSFRCPPRSAKVAQIDIDEDRAGRNYPGSRPVVGDAAVTLGALAARTSPGTADDDGRGDRLREWIHAERRAWAAAVDRSSPDGTVHPVVVLELIREVFGGLVTIVADCGTPTPFVASHWEVTEPGRSLLVARGHGPMGYAIPGGVAAALAHGGDRIVVLTTDGSLGMSCGELETAARLHLPVTFVQLTNGSYGWIKMLQHLYYDAKYFGVDITASDAAAIAGGFGVPAERVGDAAQLRRALTSAQQTDGPNFVEVIVPEAMTSPPPVAPWAAALAGNDRDRPVY